MAYNADDPKQVKEAKKQAEFDEALKYDEIRKVMSTGPGRKWIYDQLMRCHCFEISIVFGEPDRSAFNEGERNIGNQLLIDVQKASPDLYLLMIKEAKGSGT